MERRLRPRTTIHDTGPFGNPEPSNQSILLMLDFDGTLVPLMPRPQDVYVDAELIRLLEALNALQNVWVVIVSGRAMADLREKLPVVNVSMVASHGGEWFLPDHEYNRERLDPHIASRFAVIEEKLRRRLQEWPGCLLEVKPFGLAVHYRCASNHTSRSIVHEIVSVATPVIEDGSAELVNGDAVVEIRAAGINKGKAVQKLLSLAEDRCLPVYVGDDRSDEDAFRTLRGLGVTIRVGREDNPTEAEYTTNDTDAVRTLLKRCLRAWTKSSGRTHRLRELLDRGREYNAS
jgi:trehalose-phosphatase